MSIGGFFNPKVLTMKVGPLPVWAYAATMGGAYYIFSRRNGGNNKGVQAPTVTADSSGYYTGYRPSMPVAGAGGSSQPVSDPSLSSMLPAASQQAQQAQRPPNQSMPAGPPIYFSSPNGDPAHDAAIQNPATSQYLQSLYLQGLADQAATPAPVAQPVAVQYSSPTGDPVHDAAIQNPAVSTYLQSLYLAGK